jgi:hypothetical protein
MGKHRAVLVVYSIQPSLLKVCLFSEQIEQDLWDVRVV